MLSLKSSWLTPELWGEKSPKTQVSWQEMLCLPS